MEKENNLVKVEDEDGKVFDMLILKEFEHKNKKYAVLSELDCCHCDDECDCDEDSDCGCKEGKKCTCDEGCHSDDEPIICLLEITKDKDGNEIFKSIDDENLFNELIEKADKVLYED